MRDRDEIIATVMSGPEYVLQTSHNVDYRLMREAFRLGNSTGFCVLRFRLLVQWCTGINSVVSLPQCNSLSLSQLSNNRACPSNTKPVHIFSHYFANPLKAQL